MGSGLKFAKVTEFGIHVWSDWSYFTQKEVVKTKNFWRIVSMLFLSVTFCYFMKLHQSIYAKQNHKDIQTIVTTSYHAYYMGAVARIVSPMVMQKIGFYKTYLCLLVL
jgi:hypothetical protein